MKKKKIGIITSEEVIPGEPVMIEDVKEEDKAYVVELQKDVPYGPKAGIRTFESKADAEAYAKRFGGKLL